MKKRLIRNAFLAQPAVLPDAPPAEVQYVSGMPSQNVNNNKTQYKIEYTVNIPVNGPTQVFKHRLGQAASRVMAYIATGGGGTAMPGQDYTIKISDDNIINATVFSPWNEDKIRAFLERQGAEDIEIQTI